MEKYKKVSFYMNKANISWFVTQLEDGERWVRASPVVTTLRNWHPISSFVTRIAIGATDLGFDSHVGQCVATAAAFFRSCVVQALSRGDRLRPLLHALA